MPTETVFIESLDDKARIETRITYNANAENPPSIVIAHPYGPLGGNFNNNVVVALHRYFSNKGYVAASLNFRGCCNSERRTSWTGMPERGDYHAVMNYVMDRFRPSRLVIGGYSFGSMIASSMPPPTNIPYRYLLISYPLSVQWALATFKSSYFTQQFTQVLSSGKALFIYGDSDQFTGVRSYQKLKFTAPSKAVMIPGADHFWFGYEDELKAALDVHFQ